MDSAKEEGTSWEDEGSFGVVTCRDMQGDDEAFEEDGQVGREHNKPLK